MSKLLQRLSDASRSGVYRASRVGDIVEVVRGSDIDVVAVDLRPGVFDAMAKALQFPEWFGANWDALEDCLGDLSWRRDAGRVLLLSNYPTGPEFEMLLDVLRSSACFWAERGKPFFAVLIDPGHQLDLPGLYRER